MVVTRRWEKFKGVLSPFVVTSNREKVTEARRAFSVLALGDLQDKFCERRAKKAEIKDALELVDIDLMALAELLIEHMEAQGLRSVTTTSGHTIGTRVEPVVSMEDREQIEEWVLADPSRDYMWTLTPSTLETLVKETLDKGQDEQLPPGLKVTLRTGISFTKAA